MTTTEANSTPTAEQPVPMSVPMRFEVTTLPVADVDRAKAFYLSLGWTLEADVNFDEHTRVVQITPIGSPASIQFGTGSTTMTPGAGALQSLYLIVDDIVAAREDLVRHGVQVSEIWHREPADLHAPGRDPNGTSYNSFASFSDPDGNSWLVQELTDRLPGRVQLLDPASLAERLLEASLQHERFDIAAPPHHWWDWYAAYMDAREHGATEGAEASALADKYMAEVKGVVIPAE